ncbi:unnamed protein product [Lactuca saligna]|uniref:Uncharacterized protein n=1 Tax=Lactuca saligna TaxID=75948 RepID=A0AA35V5S7_LACSI|nr:unnamed protein product [Lactuca saligna]CAI9265332.1 unnamed protein product [Lactuca saligna]
MVRPPSRPGVARSSTTDAANKEKPNQQPSAPNSNAYRKKSSQGQGGKAPPRQVYRPTGKTIQSSFENTYNLPKKTADNQTEQNLFILINNKKTSQHIQISADPSTSTASHDSQLRVDSSHQRHRQHKIENKEELVSTFHWQIKRQMIKDGSVGIMK